MQLAKEIRNDIITIAGCDEKAVSIAIEEYDPSEWPEKVYRPDIIGKADTFWENTLVTLS